MTSAIADLEHHRRRALASLAIEAVDAIEQALLDRIHEALGSLQGSGHGRPNVICSRQRLAADELRIATDLLNARRHARRTFAPLAVQAAA